MSATAEKFMAPLAQKPEALPWLADAPQDKAVDWISALRATGAEAFASTGLPTSAWEGWQHTNLRPLAQAKFHYSSAPVKFDAAKIPAPLLEDTQRVVVVNGQYQPQLSNLSPGVRVMSLMEAAETGIEEWLVSVGDLAQTPLRALNTAYLRDGFVLKTDTDEANPVEILFYSAGNEVKPPVVHPRMLYWLGKNAGLTILERHCGDAAYFSNSVTEIVLEQDSRLKFHRLMQESASAFHVSFTNVHMQKDSSFEGFAMATGGRIARQEINFKLLDSGISASMNGIYLLNSQQNHDFTIVADHFEPHGKSGQFFKGVVDDQARAVFQGKIHIRRAAQASDGHQSHHALLLSRQAEASVKPELEIYADDVKCGHGATSGHLDPAALFYLQSRGIPQEQAKALLIESFLNEAVEKITFEPVRDICRAEVAAWLEQRKS